MDGSETTANRGRDDERLALPPKYREIRRRLRTGDGLALDAEDVEAGTVVFVKISRDIDAIRREAKILDALSHRGVPRLIEWGRVPDGAFLVLTQVGRMDLETFLLNSGGTVDAAAVTACMKSIADIVDTVHRAGFIHRDLKPANIVLSDDLMPSIVDFGAAIPLDRHRSVERLSQLTHGYAAPEQYLKGANEGPWTDIYALAAIAYRALFGRPPPPALARRSGEAPQLWAREDKAAREKDESATRELLAAIEIGLALEPERRPSTAKYWTDGLRFEDTPSQPSVRLATEADEGDDYPPTVVVERVGGEANHARSAADLSDKQTPVGLGRGRRFARMFAWSILAVSLAGAIAALGFWQARPLYERHIKREWLVDVRGDGDALSVTDALRRGRPDARFRIAPGVYEETVTVDGAQQLLAADPASPPTLAPASGPCLIASGNGAVVDGLSLKPAATGDAGAPPGCVILRGSDVTVMNNKIADGPGPGIVVATGSRARILNNELAVGVGPALIVRSGAEPQITENVIMNGGVVFAEGARGALTANRIVASPGSAVEIASGARPDIRENTIEAGAEAGIFVYGGGGGQMMGNRILQSGLTGALLSGGGTVTFVGNEVVGSKEHGILVLGSTAGVIERNVVRGNMQHGIVVDFAANVVVGENVVDGNAEPQIFDGRTE